MHFSIYFLLISCLSIIIGETSPLPDEAKLEKIAARNKSITGNHINLKLSTGGIIDTNVDVLVWKGTINETIDVAIKIFTKKKMFENEINIFEVLEATDTVDIEKHRIPRVYYHGPFLDKYFVIAMTLFEGTLAERWSTIRCKKGKLSEPTFLLILKQALEALSYIHSKNVTHNDINLTNIFVRGKDLFIGDFDRSKLGGNLMDEYEDFLSLMWSTVRISSNARNDLKIEYLNNIIVRKAMAKILDYSNIINGKFGVQPVYEKIIKIADDALAELGSKSGPVQFEWLEEGEQASSSGH